VCRDVPRMTKVTEIERRFLIKKMDPRVLEGITPLHIRQGYIDKGLRVRITQRWSYADPNSRTGSLPESGVLTLKSGKGLSREENNEDINPAAAKLLLASTKYVIDKCRYALPDGWEVDQYNPSSKLAGLWLAEREFSSEEEARALVLPAWLQDSVEVTDTVTNYQLARMAYFLDEPLERQDREEALLSGPLPRIVLTGAPCSGKSSAIARLRVEEPSLHCVPETATIVMGQVGARPDMGTTAFQYCIRRVQASFEAAAVRQAAFDRKAAVVLDRGTLDSAAFIGGLGAYEKLLNTVRDLEFNRYTQVIMLGLPPREVFEREKTNNPVRRETYEQAMTLQDSLLGVWTAHPNFTFIGDRDTWEEKYQAVRNAIRQTIAGAK
jgi:adenylate cyclase